jgi:hypothetical protein
MSLEERRTCFLCMFDFFILQYTCSVSASNSNLTPNLSYGTSFQCYYSLGGH